MLELHKDSSLTGPFQLRSMGEISQVAASQQQLPFFPYFSTCSSWCFLMPRPSKMQSRSVDSTHLPGPVLWHSPSVLD